MVIQAMMQVATDHRSPISVIPPIVDALTLRIASAQQLPTTPTCVNI
jgi:hypothetical protein